MTGRGATWWVPGALLALGAIPVIAGVLRLVELSGAGAGSMPPNPRFTASPVPVVLHILCAVTFAVLGAAQFSAGLRRRFPGWHRGAGRLLVVAGLGVALSALWLNQFFPRAGAARELLYPLRLGFGVAMVVTLVLGLRAARRRDIARHRAWMTRSYAIGLVAGTQAFTLGLGGAVLGHGPVTTALLLGAAWGINLAVAEWAIRRPGHPGHPGRPGRPGRPESPGRGAAVTAAGSTYELRLDGHLDDHWSARLGPLTLLRRDDGTTVLTGPLADQAQLHGVLAAVRDLGVPLLSVRAVPPARSCSGSTGPTPATSGSRTPGQPVTRERRAAYGHGVRPPGRGYGGHDREDAKGWRRWVLSTARWRS